jgi:hypothetical protein
MGSRLGLLTACAVLCAAGAAAPAQAAFPGANGKIAFSDGTDIWSINADGSNPQQLTHSTWFPGTRPWSHPEWSPDGTKIAYQDSFDIVVMNADGSNQVNITNATQPFRPFAYVHSPPSWSPDGTRIAYSRLLTDSGRPIAPPEIWTANPDGSNRVKLVTSTASSSFPRWHPDGRRIAFFACGDPCSTPEPRIINVDGTGEAALPVQSFDDWSPDGGKVVFDATANGLDVFAQRIDGSGLVNLTDHPAGDDQPNWSPDGTRIVFSSDRGNGAGQRRLWVMNADGTGVTQLTTSLARNADWQPIPISGYPRPVAASPMRVPLVLAYPKCTSPNMVHGPPLEHPSCNPVSLTSPNLHVGTADSNGAAANFRGSVRLKVMPGDPTTGADEADVTVTVAISDIRCTGSSPSQPCGDANFSAGPDYLGELQPSLTFRITDKDNTPHPGGPGAATVKDSTVSLAIACVGTAMSRGSDCAATTSMDALFPGLVKEKRRAVWALEDIEILDGGPDGMAATPEGDTVFLRQGIFAP